MHDVAIIGGGITGTSIARALARYKLRIVLLEKESDIANGTTKANSAIVHAGYDPQPGSLKGLLNARGNSMFESLCRELSVPFKRIGSLVVATDEAEMKVLEELLDRGEKNNIPGLKILNKEELKKMEPALSERVAGALYAPTAGIVDPYLLAIALAENAAANGVEIRLDSPVKAIRQSDAGYRIVCADGSEIKTRFIINAAGLYADEIHKMVGGSSFKIVPNRGQYWLLDKNAGRMVKHVIFQCPTPVTKGVVVLPTVHGNLLVGPNAEEVESKEATQTTADGLEFVKQQAKKVCETIPFEQVITSFAGLRAKTDTGDFIIEESDAAKGFINVAAIDSPGLTAAPAIARYVVDLFQKLHGTLEKNDNFNPNRTPYIPFIELPDEEKKRLIKQDPRYGRIVCRCEHVTEGEIVRAIHAPVGARTVDGLKKRVRTGMGRCQGGFCTPRVIQILARELNMDMTAVTKDGPNSNILTHPTKISGGLPVEKPSLQKTTFTPDRQKYDLVVIGGGPAGMAAALEAKAKGVERILVIERDREAGGILQQCIHNGFGLHIFKEELTGPEYAERFIEELKNTDIEIKLDTTVLHLGRDKDILCLNSQEGLITLEAGAVILAMGCRERTRGAVNIPGTRPAGIFTAGTAQRFVNIEGYMPGKKVIVFGSGDIGLIMARRMVLEGAEVIAVVERKPYSDGLLRNQVQCVHDFNIPLLLNHTIVEIKGRKRVTSVVLAKTDEHKMPIKGTEKELACDTVLFSRGLIPENELSLNAGVTLSPLTGGPEVNESMETSVPGIFACGNVVQVHDLVDWVTEESRKAGRGAAAYLLEQPSQESFTFCTKPGKGIRYIVPHQVRAEHVQTQVEFFMRVQGAHEQAYIDLIADGEVIKQQKKKKLSPGEMVIIKLKKDELPQKPFKELTITLNRGQ